MDKKETNFSEFADKASKAQPQKPKTPPVFTADIVLSAEQVEEACKRYVLAETGQTPIEAHINVGMVSVGHYTSERSEAGFHNVTVKVGMKTANS